MSLNQQYVDQEIAKMLKAMNVPTEELRQELQQILEDEWIKAGRGWGGQTLKDEKERLEYALGILRSRHPTLMRR